MRDLGDVLKAAWERVGRVIDVDPAERARRLARRDQITLRRPPRAWCLAVRASDTRIHPASAIIFPERAAYPGHPRDFDVHTVTLTAPLLRKLCEPVYLTPPGETYDDVARKLGRSPASLIVARLRGVFQTHYVRGLDGRRGHLVPLLYTPRPLDPAAQLFAAPDPVWSWTAKWLTDRLPDDFTQTLTRLPHLHPRSPGRRDTSDLHPEHPLVDRPPNRSLALPPPPPDYVWYKWSIDNQFLGDDPRFWRKTFQDPGDPAAARAAMDEKAAKIKQLRLRRKPTPRVAREPFVFRGWCWICPLCHKRCRTLFLPTPPIDFLAPETLGWGVPPIHWLTTPPADPHNLAVASRLTSFGCKRCHGVYYISHAQRQTWNHVISYLTGGMMYGHEVEQPPQLKGPRKRPYRPRASVPPSQRRAQVLERLLKGWSYAEIGQDLGMKARSVLNHTWRIYREHNVTGRRALARKLGVALPPRPSRKQEAVRAGLKDGLTLRQIAARTGLTYRAVQHQVIVLRHAGAPEAPPRARDRRARIRAEIKRRLLAGQKFREIAAALGLSIADTINRARTMYREHGVRTKQALIALHATQQSELSPRD